MEWYEELERRRIHLEPSFERFQSGIENARPIYDRRAVWCAWKDRGADLEWKCDISSIGKSPQEAVLALIEEMDRDDE